MLYNQRDPAPNEFTNIVPQSHHRCNVNSVNNASGFVLVRRIVVCIGFSSGIAIQWCVLVRNEYFGYKEVFSYLPDFE